MSPEQQEINEDKWYRRWWQWTPAMIVAYRGERFMTNRFIDRMMNRRVFGTFRYELPRWGRPTLPDGANWDFIKRITDKWEEYVRTGNREYLVDIGNYVLWEYARPSHPSPHWTPDDPGDEPVEAMREYLR